MFHQVSPQKNNPLFIIDDFIVDDSGEVTGWVCATNYLELTQEKIGTCPASSGGCPRGFHKTFECRQYGL